MNSCVLVCLAVFLLFSVSDDVLSMVDNSLVLYLTFDKDDAGSVKDISLYNNNGIIKGTPKRVEGKFESALELNGTTDSIEIPHTSILNMSKSVTMEMWVKLAADGPDSNQVGIEKGGWESGEYSLYAFYTPGNASAVQFMDLPVSCGDANSGHLGKNIKDGEWHHLAGVWDGKTIYLYTDGELSVSVECEGSLGENKKSVCIGARNGIERMLKGAVDEVRIYNRALLEAEVKKDMETLGGLYVSRFSKLAACWGTVKAKVYSAR